MAGTPDKSPDSSSGSASDELTPPTMKFGSAASVNSSATENTIKVTQASLGGPQKTMPTTTRTTQSKQVSEATSDNNEALSAGIETQDLLNDPLLLAAPRVDFRGKSAPCLNGIPMLAMIGRGGMGAVYYGVHPRLRSEVAVKVLPFHLAEQDQGMVRRFFREAQIAAQVRSPHLVNVMDVNEEAGLFFLVMEFVPGRTAGQVLKHYMEKGQPVSEKDTLDVIIAATEGLWAAHGANVVHRDIKPENIMVPYVGRGSKDFDLRRAKLMDLGLARNEDSNQSLTGAQAAMGTPGYMAPEQAMDAKTADKRSDVFSMGATIYCMLNGKPPFRGETVMKILMATMHEPHEPIIKLRPDVSPMLNEITERCLAKKQEHRFKDAKELLTALEDCKRLIAGGMSGSIPTPGTFVYRPTSTPPPGSGTNVTQMGLPSAAAGTAPGKSNKTLFMAGGGAAAVLAAGIAWWILRPQGPAPMDASRRALLEKRFNSDMADAEKELGSAKADLALLRAYHGELRDSDLVKADETYKKKVDELDKKITGLATRADLQKKVEALGKMLDAGKVDDFKKFLPEAEALAVDDYGKKQVEPLRQRGIKVAAQLRTSKEFSESIGKVRKAVGAKDLATAQTELAAAKALIPDSPDLATVEKEVKELESAVAASNKIGDLRTKLTQKQTEQDWKSAYELATEWQLLDPRNQEVGKIIGELEKKLGAEDLKKKEQEQAARLTKIFTDASDQQKKGDLDEAERTLQRLLALDEKHAGGKVLLTQVQKQIADRDAKLALEAKRRSVDESLASIKQILLDNGDIDVAKQKLDAARTEIPDDADYLKKIDEVALQVDARREQQKAIKDADALLDKASPMVLDANLDKLKEGQGLAGKALRMVPGYARAVEMSAKFDRKIDEQLKAQSANAETHNKLLASAEKNVTAAAGKPLAEQLNLLEPALRDFDDAKKLQPTGPAAKKSEETAKRINEIKTQMETQRKISAVVSSADAIAGRGNFDEALTALEGLKTLDPDAYKTKSADYTSRKAKAEELVKSQLGAIYQKAGSGRIQDALDDARTLRNANQGRTDVSAVVSVLDTASRNAGEIRAEAVAFQNRLATKDLELKAAGLGKAERDAAVAQIAAFEAIVPTQVKTLAAANFTGADNLASAIRDARGNEKYKVENAVGAYERIQAPRKVEPVRQPVGEQDPFADDKRNKPKPQKDPKPKAKGSVGEGNIDD